MTHFRRLIGPLLTATCCLVLTSGATAGCESDDCALYKEPKPASSPTIRIKNARSESIFVNPCDSRFSILKYGVLQLGELSWNMRTCADVLADGQRACCDCAWWIIKEEIVPGGTLELPWTGLIYHAGMMPDACYPGSAQPYEASGEPFECYEADVVKPGEAVHFVFHLHGPAGVPDPFNIERTFVHGSHPTFEVTVD